MVGFQHFILTAFNIDFNLRPRTLILGKEYLEKRFELFEKICLPSVTSQSCKNFKWLVFFDSETPTQFKQRIEKLQQKENFIAVYTKPLVTQDIWGKTVQKYLAEDTQFVITSNLDNDDALSNNFIALVQNNFSYQDFEFINFPFGYMLREDGLFLREYLSSPFLSLIERVDSVVTCKVISHRLLQKLSDQGVQVNQIISQPAWLQIVHDSNVKNYFDINSVIQPLHKLNKNFVAENIPANYFQSSYRKGCLSFLSRLRKSRRIPIQKKLRIILTMINYSLNSNYLRLSLGIKAMTSSSSILSVLEAKQLCQQSRK